MKRPSLLASLVSLVSLTPLACAARPGSVGARATAHPGEKKRSDDFASMTWEDRHDQMTWVVLPNMAERFQEFAGTPEATLTCRSCHGSDPESVAYRMPRGLPALDPAHLPLATDPGERGRTAKFMIETVTPTMADLLSEPLYDPKTHTGFGCFKCHPAVNVAEGKAQ